MNAPTSSPTPPPVPMDKEKILKEDGRFLFYYTFTEELNASQPTAGREQKTESTDV